MSGSSRRRDAPVVELVASPPRQVLPLDADADQQVVIDHVSTAGSGPLLVLAGPGTGKTATIVEAVAQRVIAGTDPERILVLTFSRKAAGELRDRMTARLGSAAAGLSAWTFHAYCYALVSAGPVANAPLEASAGLRLLSAPEQDGVLRDLLRGHADEGFVRWPESLRPALTTRGFADEVRRWIAEARSLDRDRATSLDDRPEWRAAAAMFDEYLEVLESRGMLDYDELVYRAVELLDDPTGHELIADRYDLVVVDEYQDTDPSQERLLQRIAGEGRDLVVVGDPDQSIYAFRGADVRAIVEFTTRFRTAAGDDAATASLITCRRSGQTLIDGARSVARLLPAPPGAGAGTGATFRDRVAAPELSDGSIEVLTFASPGAQYDHVVDQVRRAHLDDGLAWDRIAILTRSASSFAPIRRALVGAGVPVEVAGDEVPLLRDAAVTPLLTALKIVAADAATLADLDVDDTRSLLLSPLGGADSGTLRRLGRALRQEVRDAGDAVGPGEVPSSADLLHQAVLHPERLIAHDPKDAGAAQRLGQLLSTAREVRAAGGTAHEVLWTLWWQKPWRDAGMATWSERLERAVFAGGPEGRRADRDLDVIVALFELATRADERSARGGLLSFLDLVAAQEIPADTLAERGLRGDSVRVLTAHRSKGLEWDLVIVVDVHEDSWPDLRLRGSVLRTDELAGLGRTPSSQRLAEERRLFYVACTRARERLVVTAVHALAEDGPRPSRFLGDLGVEPVAVTDRPRRPLALMPLVADLRRTIESADASDALRDEAARHLAALATVTHNGRALVPHADPSTWWGVHPRTESAAPMFPADQPIPLSGSSLNALSACALKWFLAHEAHGEPAMNSAVGFGSVIHALADDLGRRDEPLTDDQMTERLDSVWSALNFDSAWQSDRERHLAEDALRRLVAWHHANRHRTLVQTEQRFSATLSVGGREVELRGSMDRVEADEDGRVVVIDLKTMKQAVTGPALKEHVQLGVYQLAVREGALAEVEGIAADAPPGGAELVQLRLANGDLPREQRQEPIEPRGEPAWIDEVVAAGVDVLVREDFTPNPSSSECRFCPFTASCPAQPDGRTVV